jgi:hypothetical protein
MRSAGSTLLEQGHRRGTSASARVSQSHHHVAEFARPPTRGPSSTPSVRSRRSDAPVPCAAARGPPASRRIPAPRGCSSRHRREDPRPHARPRMGSPGSLGAPRYLLRDRSPSALLRQHLGRDQRLDRVPPSVHPADQPLAVADLDPAASPPVRPSRADPLDTVPASQAWSTSSGAGSSGVSPDIPVIPPSVAARVTGAGNGAACRSGRCVCFLGSDPRSVSAGHCPQGARHPSAWLPLSFVIPSRSLSTVK